MKTRTLISAMAVWFGSATAALAASGAREDNSGIFVWVFLAFCALIVVAQLLPAVLMMTGFVKGMGREPEGARQKAAH